MEIKSFKWMFIERDAVNLNDDLWIFRKGWELYSFKTDTAKRHKSLDELIEKNPDVKDIIENAEKDDFKITLNGGRGSGSGSQEMGGGFKGNTATESKGIPRFPATFNAMSGRGSVRTTEGTIRDFAGKHATSDHEYAIVVDKQGFVHSYSEGAKHSVIPGGGTGTVVHNHPSGSNFSDADLLNTASSSKWTGVVAVGGEKTYSFSKGSNFDAKGFIKGVQGAQWPANMDYNQGADWWLRRNAKTYGYSYSARATKR